MSSESLPSYDQVDDGGHPYEEYGDPTAEFGFEGEIDLEGLLNEAKIKMLSALEIRRLYVVCIGNQRKARQLEKHTLQTLKGGTEHIWVQRKRLKLLNRFTWHAQLDRVREALIIQHTYPPEHYRVTNALSLTEEDVNEALQECDREIKDIEEGVSRPRTFTIGRPRLVREDSV
jgi:hypothetical protein